MSFTQTGNSLSLLSPGNRSFTILCSGRDEHKGVLIAIDNLQADFERVCGVKPEKVNGTADNVKIIIGSIDSSPIIKQLIKAKKLDANLLKGKNEKYIITTLHSPLKGIEGDVLLIAGSDKRGTIYGIYELSKQMGISPWYWWADVPVQHQDAIYIKEGILHRW